MYHFRQRTLVRPLLVAFLSVFCATAARADLGEMASALDPAVQHEIEFADALTQMGMPDYAAVVMARITDPSAGPLLKVIRLRGLLAMGKFDEVKQIIAAEPEQESQEAWAMKLALGDALYAWGRYGEARGVYTAFFARFKNGPPDSLKGFYIDSAYKYSQMLLLLGARKEAIDAYDDLLKAKVQKHVRRQVLGEMLELIVKLAEESQGAERKAYLARIEKICNEILWVQDLWFGKAIVILAHVAMIEGEVDEAIKLVEDYLPQLQAIDQTLKDQSEETGEELIRLSPMAECRYMLGTIMQDEAERLLAEGGDRERIVELLAGKVLKTRRPQAGKPKRSAGALQHFLNVFIAYPMTSWAPGAGKRARAVEDLLTREFGAKIKTSITDEQMEKVRRAQFQVARTLFHQRQFQQAADIYGDVLNLFPEADSSIAALGDLTKCYIELDDEIYAETSTRYLAERFSLNETLQSRAGDELLRLVPVYEDRNRADKRDAVYALFMEFFLDHPRAASTRFYLAEQAFDDEDFDTALGYYRDIAANFRDTPLFLQAVGRIASCYSEMGNAAMHVKALTAYATLLEREPTPGHTLIATRYRLASAYRDQGGAAAQASAIREYDALVAILEGDRARYQQGTEETEQNQRILEGSLFYKAFCLANMPGPEQELAGRRRQAIEILNGCAERFPDSPFGPPALSQVGTVWTALGEAEEARKALAKLQAQYPESLEAKNAMFMLGKNLLNLGLKQRAAEVFAKMFDGSGQYGEAQILTAGTELLKAGELDIALRAFDQVLRTARDRALLEPAMLGKGKALDQLERAAEAAAILDELLEKYPNSGYTVEASLILSRAFAAAASEVPDADARFDMFNKAVKAMRTVRRHEQTPGGRARSDVGVARIFAAKAAAERKFGRSPAKERDYKNEAIAAFQALILLGDVSDKGVRRYIEEAYAACLPLLVEIERWEDVLEDCDSYLAEFPRGPNVAEVRKLRSRARTKLAMAGKGEEDTTAAGPGTGGRM